MPEKTYPNYLVPNKNLPIIDDANLDRSHYLGVWVNSDRVFKNSDGKLDIDAIEIIRIPGFSTNKIPDSIESDLNICFIGDNSDYFNYTAWQLGEDGSHPANDDFELKNDRNHYFIQISKIDGYSSTYNNPPDKIHLNYNFTLKVTHAPLVANYWHFQFDIKSDHGALERAKSAWQKLICSKIRVKIQEIVDFELP